MAEREYVGVLCIGDPHLEGRAPGHRKDDYPLTILDKLAWCLEYAESNRLLPAILGDLFEKPRDNPNWLLVRLIDMLQGEVIGLFGNHDVRDPQLKDDDSLSVLVRSGRLRLVDAKNPWQGTMNGREVMIAGSSYRQEIPEELATDPNTKPLVIWLTHHDISVPGYELASSFRAREIPGVAIVVNGHLHEPVEPLRRGSTTWITPGNISRRKRTAKVREHVPAALRIDVQGKKWSQAMITIPHRPFDEVFHDVLVAPAEERDTPSAFIAGLAELQARRTESGAGLLDFLETNKHQFELPVQEELLALAQETLNDGQEQS